MNTVSSYFIMLLQSLQRRHHYFSSLLRRQSRLNQHFSQGKKPFSSFTTDSFNHYFLDITTNNTISGHLGSREKDFKYTTNLTHIGTLLAYYQNISSLLEDIHKKYCFSTSSNTSSTSSNKRRKYIPRQAPVKLTPKARKFFQDLIELKLKPKDSNDESADTSTNKDTENISGIILKYQQSTTGQPRMVFTFEYVTQSQLSNRDEPVSLEVIGTKKIPSDKSVSDNDSDVILEEIPKSPEDSYDDGLPKLYIHQHAFLKVLGCTIDVDTHSLTPILYDKEGNELDPNA